jgi:hypothetical protein
MNNFCIDFGVACEETVFNCNQEHFVNFVTEGITVLFRKINEVTLPESVGVFKSKYDGD